MNEYYMLMPNVKTFGGIKVKKDTHFDVYNDDQTVHQILDNLVLTTEINRESEYAGMKIKDNSKLSTELPEDTVIIWNEDTGYVVPERQMVRPEEAIKLLNFALETTSSIEEGTKNAIKGE